jgi:hypothetical protein
LQVYDSPGKLVNRSGCVVEDQSEHEKHSKELFPSTDINELLEEIPVPDFECGAGESDSESEGWEDESIDDFEDDGVDSDGDGGGGSGGGGSGNVSGGEDLSGNVYKFSWGANAARSETTSSHKGSVLQGAEVLTSGGFISRFAQGAAVLLRQHAKVLLRNVRRASSTKLTSLAVLPASPASDLLAGIMSILEARTEQLEKSSAPTGERAWASSALVSPPSCTTSACCGIKSLRCELCFDGTMPSSSQVKF